MYHFGVRQRKITLEQMCRYLAENPAKLYGLYPAKGLIAAGSDGDIVVWDPNKELKWTIITCISTQAAIFNTRLTASASARSGRVQG